MVYRCATESIFDECKTNGTAWITGPQIHKKYSTLKCSIGESFLVLWVYIVLFRGLFYVFLRYFNRPK